MSVETGQARKRRYVPCRLVALAAYNIHARNVGARQFAARTGVEWSTEYCRWFDSGPIAARNVTTDSLGLRPKKLGHQNPPSNEHYFDDIAERTIFLNWLFETRSANYRPLESDTCRQPPSTMGPFSPSIRPVIFLLTGKLPWGCLKSRSVCSGYETRARRLWFCV